MCHDHGHSAVDATIKDMLEMQLYTSDIHQSNISYIIHLTTDVCSIRAVMALKCDAGMHRSEGDSAVRAQQSIQTG